MSNAETEASFTAEETALLESPARTTYGALACSDADKKRRVHLTHARSAQRRGETSAAALHLSYARRSGF